MDMFFHEMFMLTRTVDLKLQPLVTLEILISYLQNTNLLTSFTRERNCTQQMYVPLLGSVLVCSLVNRRDMLSPCRSLGKTENPT